MRKLMVLTLVSLILLQITPLFAGKWTSDGKKFASDLAYYASKVRKYNDRYVILCVPLKISFLSPDLTDESFGITGMGFSLGDYKDPECLVDFAIKYYKKSKIMKNIEKNYKILIRYDPEEYSKNPYRVLYYDRSMKYLVDLIEKYGSRESESGLDFMKKGEVIGYWRSWSQEEWDFIKLVGSVKAFYDKTIRKLVGTQCFGMKAHCLLEVRDYLDNADEDDIREYYIAGILKNGGLVVQGILAFKVGRKYYLAALGGKYDFENTVDEDYAELLQYKPGYIDEKWLNSYLKFMESGKKSYLGAGNGALIFYWDPEKKRVKGILDIEDRQYYIPLPSGDGTRVYIKSKIYKKVSSVFSYNNYSDIYSMCRRPDYPIEYLRRLIVLGVEYYPEKDKYKVWAYKDSMKEVKEWLEKRKKIDCTKIPSGDDKKDLYCKIRIVSGVLSSSDALLRHLEQYRMSLPEKSLVGYEDSKVRFDRKNKKILFIKYEDKPLAMEYDVAGYYDYYKNKRRIKTEKIIARYFSGKGIFLASEIPIGDIEEILVRTNY